MRYVPNLVFLFFLLSFWGEGMIECRVSLAILGTEMEREGERMMLGICLLVYCSHIQQVSFMFLVLLSEPTKYANSDVCRFFSCSITDTRTGTGRRYVFVL